MKIKFRDIENNHVLEVVDFFLKLFLIYVLIVWLYVFLAWEFENIGLVIRLTLLAIIPYILLFVRIGA